MIKPIKIIPTYDPTSNQGAKNKNGHPNSHTPSQGSNQHASANNKDTETKSRTEKPQTPSQQDNFDKLDQLSLNSLSGKDALDKQNHAAPQEAQKVNDQNNRLAASGQMIDEANSQRKKLMAEHNHQGALGRTTEALHNGLHSKNCYNNVNRRTQDLQRHAGDLAYQTSKGGNPFSSHYQELTGAKYDPKNPVRKDPVKHPFQGELGKNQKGINAYVKTQKIGNIIQSIFFPGMGPAAMAAEDNTRGDGTHDFKAKDYLKAGAISAAGLLPIPGLDEAISSISSIAGKATGQAAGKIAEQANTSIPQEAVSNSVSKSINSAPVKTYTDMAIKDSSSMPPNIRQAKDQAYQEVKVLPPNLALALKNIKQQGTAGPS